MFRHSVTHSPRRASSQFSQTAATKGNQRQIKPQLLSLGLSAGDGNVRARKSRVFPVAPARHLESPCGSRTNPNQSEPQKVYSYCLLITDHCSPLAGFPKCPNVTAVTLLLRMMLPFCVQNPSVLPCLLRCYAAGTLHTPLLPPFVLWVPALVREAGRSGPGPRRQPIPNFRALSGSHGLSRAPSGYFICHLPLRGLGRPMRISLPVCNRQFLPPF